MGEDVQRAADAMRQLFVRTGLHRLPGQERRSRRPGASSEILYQYYVQHRHPPEDQRKKIAGEGVERCVVDYVAGMTDHFAIEIFEIYFLPFS